MNQQPISPTASDFSSDMLDHNPFDALLTVTQYALGSGQNSRRLDLILHQYLYIECEWPFHANVENFIVQIEPFEERVIAQLGPFEESTNGLERNDLQGFTVVNGSDMEDTIAGHVSRMVKERHPPGRLVFVDIPIGRGMKCLIFLACLWGWQVDFYTRDVASVEECELRWAFPRLVCCFLHPEFHNVEPVATMTDTDVSSGEP